eukprot:4003073-Lingulodinium_polyedra.AAC.1
MAPSDTEPQGATWRRRATSGNNSESPKLGRDTGPSDPAATLGTQWRRVPHGATWRRVAPQ